MQATVGGVAAATTRPESPGRPVRCTWRRSTATWRRSTRSSTSLAPPSRASSALNCRRYPDTALTDFNGNPVRLGEQWPDGPTAIVFWSPTYGFCQRPLPDLRAREADRAPGAPRLLLVSSGSAAPQLSVSEDLCSVAFTRR